MHICTVVHNEADRLPKWLDHHAPLADIIIIDQSSTDGTEFPNSIQVITTPASGLADPDYNLLQELTDDWVLLLGIDEFISEEHLQVLLDAAKQFPTIKCFIMRRIDYVNDIDCSDLKASQLDQPGIIGCDWQPRFTKGAVCKYSGVPHQHPLIQTRWGYIDGNSAWIEHRREWDTLLAANESRYHLLDASGISEQAKFLTALSAKLGVEYDA